jgi:hypothetical protein
VSVGERGETWAEKACVWVGKISSSYEERQPLHFLGQTWNKLKQTVSPREKFISKS